MPPVTTADTAAEQQASSSILKERRFKLSRSVLVVLLDLSWLLTLIQYSGRATDAGELICL